MVNKVQKRRSIPPSRVRYEASHPTVSVRVSRDLYDELKELEATTGLSTADILKVGLEKGQATTGDAYRRGYLACLSEALGAVQEECDCWNQLCELIPDDDGGQAML